MTAIEICDAGPTHAELIARLHKKCLGIAWTGEAIRSLLALPGGFALLAHADAARAPVGFALCIPGGEGIEIAAVGVLPKRRRQGIAKRLLDSVFDRAAALDARDITLEVAADNLPAQRLYAAAGFTEVGRRPGYYAAHSFGDPRDALVLRASCE